MAVRARRVAVIDVLDDDRLLARIAALKDDNNLTGLRWVKKRRNKRVSHFVREFPRVRARRKALAPVFVLNPQCSRSPAERPALSRHPARRRDAEVAASPIGPAPERRSPSFSSRRPSSRTLRNLTISSVRGKGGCRRVAKPFSPSGTRRTTTRKPFHPKGAPWCFIDL